jgi:ribosomal-protein-alanine N-acetyltransferase
MKAIRILPLSEEHLAAAAQLEQLCFAEPWSEQALVMLTREGGYGVVALTESGTVVGYGGMILAPDDGQITNIAVHPDQRRQGIGDALLSALTEKAIALGLAEMSLEVRESNVAAIRLYLRHGFDVAGKRKHFYRHPTEDALVMIRKNN